MMRPALPVLAFLMSSAVLVAEAWRLPPDAAAGDAEVLEAAALEMESRLQGLKDERMVLAGRMDELMLAIKGIQSSLDRLDPGGGVRLAKEEQLGTVARNQLVGLIDHVQTSFDKNESKRIRLQITEDVSRRLKLTPAQKASFAGLLDNQYAYYDLSVRRYGRDGDQVQGDYRARREQGVERLEQILTSAQRAQWQAQAAAWHPWLKVLFGT